MKAQSPSPPNPAPRATAKGRSPVTPHERAQGIVIGTTRSAPAAFGFSTSSPETETDVAEVQRAPAQAHGLVVASTGAGKLVSSVVPNVLAHGPGQLFILDPKGEIAAITARERRRFGQVAIIDPFGVLESGSDALNPLDLLHLPNANIEADADMLAWELAAGHESERDPFWVHASVSLLAGLIASAANEPSPEARSLLTVLDELSNDDVVYKLAVKLDNKAAHGDFAYKRIAEFLQTPDGTSSNTRGCVLVSLQQMLHSLQCAEVRQSLARSSFALSDVLAGESPMTVYFVFPPSKSRSHRGLLRLWMSTVLNTLIARPRMPERKTMVIIDEAANLGRLDLLPMMYSYLRGCGVSLLTLWQSLGQLSDLYPRDWRVIVENSGIIQAFGLHATATGAVSDLLGVPPALLHQLGPDEQIVARADRAPEMMTRLDYRTHPMFKGCRIDPNPRYELVRDSPPKDSTAARPS